MGRVTRRFQVTRVDLSPHSAVPVSRREDTVAVEEPLEIRTGGQSLTVTMRTPGDDFDLAMGLLVTEGIIGAASEVRALMHCLDEDEDGSPTYNVVDATLTAGTNVPDSARRTFYSSSACGVCGKAGIDQVRTKSPYDVSTDPLQVSAAVVASLPERLRVAQKVFDRTGGLHAAGLFTPGGELLAIREDVGRHNAVDKVIGWAVREGRLPLTGHLLCVSGRASFELTQKAFMAGIPLLAAVSAPSSLAVDLAREVGMTLVAFVRPPRLTVYSDESPGGPRLTV